MVEAEYNAQTNNLLRSSANCLLRFTFTQRLHEKERESVREKIASVYAAIAVCLEEK